jgi:hypothetical protein
MPETENPGLQISPEIFEILQAGVDYSELEKTAGYRRLMKYLKGRTDAALQAMRDAPYADDKVRLGFLIQWQFCEDIVRDIQNEIKDRMALASSIVKDLDVNTAAREGFAHKFGNDERGEENGGYHGD